MFKVGQKVWDIRFGWGFVTRIKEGYELSVGVDFGRIHTWYTQNGEYTTRENRSLFFEELPIPESALGIKKWRAKIGEKAYFVTSTGHVDFFFDYGNLICNNLYEKGNYFETYGEAMKSKFYKVFHG